MTLPESTRALGSKTEIIDRTFSWRNQLSRWDMTRQLLVDQNQFGRVCESRGAQCRADDPNSVLSSPLAMAVVSSLAVAD